MTRAFARQKPLSKTAAKTAAKVAEYEAAPKGGSTSPKIGSKPMWVRHQWNDARGKVIARRLPGLFPRPGKDWFAEGSIDEIEAQENAGQICMF
jgi:hypothetical protein